MLKKYKVLNGMVKASGDEVIKMSPCHAMSFLFFCLKDRTSFQRLITLEIGKKARQNLEHNISQSPFILPTVLLYHCLALPIKENGNNFHLKVLLDMPVISKHAQVCPNSHRCEYGFSSPSPEKDLS